MSGSADVHDRPRATRAASGIGRRPVLPRAAGFWLVCVVLFLMLVASAAASPLYSVYQARWRFSATTLTAVFAVYVLVLLLTLLVFGSLSDYLGRRPVIAVAVAAGAGARAGDLPAAYGWASLPVPWSAAGGRPARVITSRSWWRSATPSLG